MSTNSPKMITLGPSPVPQPWDSTNGAVLAGWQSTWNSANQSNNNEPTNYASLNARRFSPGGTIESSQFLSSSDLEASANRRGILSFLEPHFDVTTANVIQRLKIVMLMAPKEVSFYSTFPLSAQTGGGQPQDWFGPFWIAVTMSLLLPVTKHAHYFSAVLFRPHPDSLQQYAPDFGAVLPAFLFVCFWEAILVGLFHGCSLALLSARSPVSSTPSPSLSRHFTVIGYSMTPFVLSILLASVFHLFPSVQLCLLLVSGAIAAVFLYRTMSSELSQCIGSSTNVIIMEHEKFVQPLIWIAYMLIQLCFVFYLAHDMSSLSATVVGLSPIAVSKINDVIRDGEMVPAVSDSNVITPAAVEGAKNVIPGIVTAAGASGLDSTLASAVEMLKNETSIDQKAEI